MLSRVTRADALINGARAEGQATELYHPELDSERAPTVYNAVCYSERAVGCFSRLLRANDPEHSGIVLHHRKIIMKDADSAGAGSDVFGNKEKPVRRGATEDKKNSFLWHQGARSVLPGLPRLHAA